MKRSVRFFLFFIFFAMSVGLHNIVAQAYQSRLEQGIRFYRDGNWTDAALELRRARMDAVNSGQLAESLYWLSLTEFSLGEYEAALRDINEMQRIAPAGLRADNILYYKGRSLYHLDRYEEALEVFRLYEGILGRSRNDAPRTQSQKATLTYWIGECLYALGQQDQAAELFTRVVDTKPKIEKHEAASYRLIMIRQNKLQEELLGMLDWSYSECLRLEEEYRNRETAFNETIAAYKKQMNNSSGDPAYTAELETGLAEYRKLLSNAEERIRILEARLSETETVKQDISAPPLAAGQDDTIRRIRELKAEAEKLRAARPGAE
jgi:tetratricopeptide (TPR) repeat protein